MQYVDAMAAVTAAAHMRVTMVVGWKPGGWVIYSPQAGAPIGVEPELLVLAGIYDLGRKVIPLSDTGFDVWVSALTSLRRVH